MGHALKGQCLCGAVEFSADLEKQEVGVCHCSMCRRWTGGAFMAASVNNVHVDDESSLSFYKSSQWGERGFCRECGSSLFWRTQDQGHWVVSVNALNNIPDMVLNSEIFYDEKPSYFDFKQETHKMTSAEVIAAFAPQSDNAKDDQ